MGANLWGGSPLWEYRLGLIEGAQGQVSRLPGKRETRLGEVGARYAAAMN